MEDKLHKLITAKIRVERWRAKKYHCWCVDMKKFPVSYGSNHILTFIPQRMFLETIPTVEFSIRFSDLPFGAPVHGPVTSTVEKTEAAAEKAAPDKAIGSALRN